MRPGKTKIGFVGQRARGFTQEPSKFDPADTGEAFRSEVLEQLRRAGSDINRTHEFDFFLYFPTAVAARTAAARARRSEFSTRVAPAPVGKGWLCRAKISVVPDLAPWHEIGRFFTQLAASLEGEFDGWESEVVKRGRKT